MSQQVLARIRARRRARISFAIRLLIVCLVVVFIPFRGYIAYRAYKKINAPSWAQFTGASTTEPLRETVLAVNEDGVPSYLYINSERWAITKVDHFADAEGHPAGERFGGDWAETYCGANTIAYIETEDKVALRDSLMHEVFHAGACLHGGDSWWNSLHPDHHDHPGVYHLGAFMMTFARDNPRFMLWEMERGDRK